MAPRAGFEPATYPLGGDCAIQLCHRGIRASGDYNEDVYLNEQKVTLIGLDLLVIPPYNSMSF